MPPISFRPLSPRFEDVILPAHIDEFVHLWEGRFGTDALAGGGIASFDGDDHCDTVLSAYLAQYAGYLNVSDFDQITVVKDRAPLLRQLFLFDADPTSPHVIQVESTSAAKAFAQKALELLASDGAIFSNTSPTTPFRSAPQCDLSTNVGSHFARSACTVLVTTALVIRVEVLFEHIVEA